MQNNRGFTLIELIVTIAVLAIIAIVAAPSFVNLLSKQKLDSTTRDLIGTLTNAKNQAVILRKDVTVQLNSSVADTTLQYNWQPTIGNTLTTPTTVPSLIFTADGTLKNTNNVVFTSTNFVICNSKANITKTITLTRMGQIIIGSDGVC